jgi:hypothetical protein
MEWNERNFLRGRVKELGHNLGRTREQLFSGDREVFAENKLDEALAGPPSGWVYIGKQMKIQNMVKANLKEYRKRMKRV